MKLSYLLVAVGFLGVSPILVTGCAADADAPQAEDDEVEASQDELSANARKLAGAWQDKGDAVRPPTFKGLVLNEDGTFFADIDSGIRPFCLPGGPCPDAQTRIEGRFTAGRKYLTLSPNSGAARSSYHGRYPYTLQGDKLSLTRASASGEWQGWFDSLSREHSYCKQVVDCGEQMLPQPRCIGAWSCGAARTCDYRCFAPPPPPPPSGCAAHTDISSCNGDPACFAILGPSACTPDGRICTADLAFKSCVER